jgi:superfamily II DNA or RNA helicase
MEGFSLNEHGYKVPIHRKYYIQFKNDLTLEQVNDFTESRKQIQCYYCTKTHYIIPRVYGFQTFQPIEYDYPKAQRIESHTFNTTLREYQEKIVNEVQENFGDPFKRGGILNLSTGSGKTVLALYLIQWLKYKTIIFVHKTILLEQWKERINQFLPNAKVGIIKGPICEIENVDIVIAMIQTVSNANKSFHTSTFESFGLCIVDEIHTICTQTFSKCVHFCRTKYRLGLSATLRRDGFQKVYEYFIGPVISTLKQTIMNPRIKVFKTKFKIDLEFNKYTKRVNFSKALSDLSEHPTRNEFICEIIRNLYATQKRKTIVFCDRIAQIEILYEKLSSNDSFPFRVDTFIGKKKKLQLDDALNADVILATYSIAKEGFDLPALDCLLFASPKSEIEQAVGRILRQKNTFEPLVIDLYDTEIFMFKNQFWKRMKYYQLKEYRVNYSH